jgi:hypothetical protein
VIRTRFFFIYVSILALVGASGCSAVKTAQAFNQVGNDFMTALRNAQYKAGYVMMAELQSKVGTAVDLEQMIEENNAQPQEWTFSSWNMSTDANQNNIAKVEGSVTYQDGRKGAVTLELVKVGEQWQVMSFNLTW